MQDNDKSDSPVSGPVPLYNVPDYANQQSSKSPVCVNWKISANEDLTKSVGSGTAYTSSDVDYTLKVEAKHLQPYTTYYYQFQVCGTSTKSMVGRTKTAPHPNDHVTGVKLAVYSCKKGRTGLR